MNDAVIYEQVWQMILKTENGNVMNMSMTMSTVTEPGR